MGFEILEQKIENTGIVASSLFTGGSIAITTIRSSNNNDNKYEIEIDIFRVPSTSTYNFHFLKAY